MNAPPISRQALAFVLKREGGYVNDPDDRGGETNYGISKRAYPHLDIASLTLDQAEAIYLDDFWHGAGCDLLPEPVGFALFDSAVQHGVRNASRMLQRELRVTADGIVGPQTAKAAHKAEPLRLVHGLLLTRAKLYHDLAIQEGQAKFYGGWMSRLFHLQRAVLEALL